MRYTGMVRFVHVVYFPVQNFSIMHMNGLNAYELSEHLLVISLRISLPVDECQRLHIR